MHASGGYRVISFVHLVHIDLILHNFYQDCKCNYNQGDIILLAIVFKWVATLIEMDHY